MKSPQRIAPRWIADSAVKWLPALAFAALCAACVTSPDDKAQSDAKPIPDFPDAFELRTSDVAAWPITEWYRNFSSDELNTLIALAEQNNLDLAAAQARLRQADARARAAGAALLPQVDLVGNAAHFQGRSGDQHAQETDWSALVSASYEIDFWGRNRATRNAAQALTMASQADRETLKLTTLSSVASTYFQVLSLRERIEIAQSNLALSRDVLGGIQARYDAGAAGPIALAAQKAAVANAELAIFSLQQQEVEARAALALLVGKAPEGFSVIGKHLDGLSEPVIAPGLPSELLARRPDIFSAENSLAAAHADVAAARAALFPAMTLTASGGAQNPAMQAAVITLEGTGPSLIFGAAIVQSIFDAGRRRAVRDEATAKEQELLATYRSSILSALVDVETALAAVRHLELQQPAQAEYLLQSERASEGARLRFREGATDYLTLFEAQRLYYTARDQFSQYKLARLQAIIGLSRALGGGWQSPSSESPPP
jgi:NodT family efflux transporter outer membrane factor (OMF) lipoprotein